MINITKVQVQLLFILGLSTGPPPFGIFVIYTNTNCVFCYVYVEAVPRPVTALILSQICTAWTSSILLTYLS